MILDFWVARVSREKIIPSIPHSLFQVVTILCEDKKVRFIAKVADDSHAIISLKFVHPPRT